MGPFDGLTAVQRRQIREAHASRKVAAARHVPSTNEPKLACPVCERTDITIKKDGTLRTHGGEKYTTWDGRHLREFCKGTGEKPKEG